MGVLDWLKTYGGGVENPNVYDRGPPPFERNLNDMSWLERRRTLEGSQYRGDPFPGDASGGSGNTAAGTGGISPRDILSLLLMQSSQGAVPSPAQLGNPTADGYVPSLIRPGPPY